MSTSPRFNARSFTLFRIQTLLVLKEKAMSGYDLAKRLEELTDKKPSTGKLYPFLHQLKENGYVNEIEDNASSERDRTVYKLTSKGAMLINEILDKMENILTAKLEQMLETCRNCAVRLFESKVTGTDVDKNDAVFCCTHCRDVYYLQYDIS